jgi:Na+/H+-dicarboxylate symporter
MLLAFDAALHVGVGLAVSLVQYVLMLSAVLVVALGVALAIGAIGSGRPLGFVRAALPVLAIAASTQSSMACLPALLRAGRESLGLPVPLVGAVTPLAVTTFRFGNVFGGLSAGLIGAGLCGIHPGIGQIALACGIGALTNIGVIGLPGSAVLFAAYGPVFAALGTPIEMIGLLIPVFTLPDILDTGTNVTADLAVTAIAARMTAGGREES